MVIPVGTLKQNSQSLHIQRKWINGCLGLGNRGREERELMGTDCQWVPRVSFGDNENVLKLG